MMDARDPHNRATRGRAPDVYHVPGRVPYDIQMAPE
jgi:hypothetical protein